MKKSTFYFILKLFAIYIVLLPGCSLAQTLPFKKKQLPFEYEKIYQQNCLNYLYRDQDKDGFDLTKLLPKNYVTDGSVDYAEFLQKGLDLYRNVIFPNFSILIGDSGLTIKSNSVLRFSKNSKLLKKPTVKDTYEVLRIHSVYNVKVYSPVIEGDKYSHLGANGQWGMGIAIRGSKNVSVFNAKVSKCWGDGIYVGEINKMHSQNISIYNAYLNDNRRNGISVISVDSLKIINPVILNTNGQMPMCGIDIEPNNKYNIIKNILIKDAVTFNNKNYGIILSLKGLIGNETEPVSIDIDGHVDDGSSTGLVISEIKSMNYKPLKGNIKIENATWMNYTVRAFRYAQHNFGFNVDIKNVKIEKKDKNGKLRSDAREINRIKQVIIKQSNISLN